MQLWLLKYILLYSGFTAMKSACINDLILEAFPSITMKSNLRQEPRYGLYSEQGL